MSVGAHVEDLTRVGDVELTPPPPVQGGASEGAVTSGNYSTTTEATPISEGAAWSLHAVRKPAPDPADQVATEAERLRLQHIADRAEAAKEAVFDGHVDDALNMTRDQAS